MANAEMPIEALIRKYENQGLEKRRKGEREADSRPKNMGTLHRNRMKRVKEEKKRQSETVQRLGE